MTFVGLMVGGDAFGSTTFSPEVCDMSHPKTLMLLTKKLKNSRNDNVFFITLILIYLDYIFVSQYMYKKSIINVNRLY